MPMDVVAAKYQTVVRSVHSMNPATGNQQRLTLLDHNFIDRAPGRMNEIRQESRLLRCLCLAARRTGCPFRIDLEILRGRFNEIEDFCATK